MATEDGLWLSGRSVPLGSMLHPNGTGVRENCMRPERPDTGTRQREPEHFGSGFTAAIGLVNSERNDESVFSSHHKSSIEARQRIVQLFGEVR